ncbi:hypothetical protein BDN70DRAFT_979492 [Pholiota conissans]|uniref:F-box domain-containing protein n=1 Tax=Pholiota conissans TaxID=109636 RepID=A0A9P6CUC7_9AGAR|nr:hypothetical protein BDN70DRAFT_979492 [Pholiota conissans]
MALFYKAPIDNLPYEVIREIFINCVSTYPFRRPNARLEPMLLTQICSSWRSIALDSPILWTHLYFCLAIAESDFGTWIIPKKQVELLRWWKGNHGSMMPHLYFEAEVKHPDVTQEYLLIEDSWDFILAYISSATYLYMDKFYWSEIEDHINDGGDEIIFPRLPNWVTLIHSFPKLQWGHFHLHGMYGPVDNISPSKRTLLDLTDIFITFNGYDAIYELCTILKSTPNITTLILGPKFHYLETPYYESLFHSKIVTKPIWEIATQLIYLQLEIDLFSFGGKYASKEALDIFIKNAFLSNTGWLLLKNPMCPIQKISIVDHGLLSLFNGPPGYALASLHDLSSEIPNIRFDLTPNSPRRNADEAWKDWH